MKKLASLLLLLAAFACCGWANEDQRIDCSLKARPSKPTKSACEKFGCIYSKAKNRNAPECYFGKQTTGYEVVGRRTQPAGLTVDLKLKQNAKGPFDQFRDLKFEVYYLTDRILRFKIWPRNESRYEVPVQKDFPLLKTYPKEEEESKRKYKVDLTDNGKDFDLVISRKDNNATIFDTSLGPLYYSDQFLHIATRVATTNVFGTGENQHPSFRHDFDYKTWPVFAKGEPPNDNEKNNYGVHPFYTVIESDGKAHGILFLNSNAMEFTFIPAPGISIKTIGGVLDFFVFLGDYPDQVVQLYTSLIGRPVMPPYWGLGFQLTRWGYQNTSHVQQTIDRNRAAGIPMDVHYLDLDYMHRFQDFTYDRVNFANLSNLIADTKKNLGIKWVLIIDPGIEGNDSRYEPFMEGMKNDVFIKWPKNVSMKDRRNPNGVMTDRDIMYGRVWPHGPVAFPDFFKNQTKIWWKKWLRVLYEDLKVEYDGIWIDMNEPANKDGSLHCPKSRFDNIPVKIKPDWVHGSNKTLTTRTICMVAVQGPNDEYKHYDVHSLYGFSETPPTQEAVKEVTKKRGLVVTRSSYVSSGRYSAHWFGDNASKWTHLKNSIINMLDFSLFGFAWTGADICGFFKAAEPEMCRVWSLLGAFYPFSRNHNIRGEPAQDPAAWIERGHPEVTAAARNSLNIRYQLLPHLYTLFYRSHRFGETLVRSLGFEFPTDSQALAVDEQFMWGASMIISPALRKGQKEIVAYLPKDTWYLANWSNMTFDKVESKGQNVTLSVSDVSAPVHFRGGSIIPLGTAALNTVLHRKEGLKLLVLHKNKEAIGELFWDDGDSIDTIEKGEYSLFKMRLFSNCSLVINKENGGINEPVALKTVTVCSLDGNDNITVTINGQQTGSAKIVDGQATLAVDINLNSNDKTKWIIAWKNTANKCNIK